MFTLGTGDKVMTYTLMELGITAIIIIFCVHHDRQCFLEVIEVQKNSDKKRLDILTEKIQKIEYQLCTRHMADFSKYSLKIDEINENTRHQKHIRKYCAHMEEDIKKIKQDIKTIKNTEKSTDNKGRNV